jgi:hypothetical protein
MDKLERIGHLLNAALSKARKLQAYELDQETRQRVADLMKRANESHKRIQALAKSPRSNGKGIDKAVLDSTLDELIATFEDVNRKLDELLAKARG